MSAGTAATVASVEDASGVLASGVEERLAIEVVGPASPAEAPARPGPGKMVAAITATSSAAGAERRRRCGRVIRVTEYLRTGDETRTRLTASAR